MGLTDAMAGAADEVERLANGLAAINGGSAQIRIGVAGQSDRERAEELLRNLTPEYLAALKRKLGL